MKILLFGREGQVAWELRRTLAPLGEVIALDRRSPQLPVDLADGDSVRAAIRALRPGLIVNGAGYTAVDQAEQDQETARRVNGIAPGIMAEEALALGAGLIHYSTDYVFPGSGQTPYQETDPTGPQGVYGQSKLEGEHAIAQVGGRYWIFRTAWVYGTRGRNFLLTMLKLMGQRELLRVVDDQRGAPTWSRMIAEATAMLIAQIRDNREQSGRGIYHLTCAGEANWCEFAASIRELAIAHGLLPETCASLEAIPSSAYPTPAQRPAYSVLSNQRLAQDYDIRLPHWRDALALCMADLPKAG
jgi:dTDP-4-dehydrorhamnose reductase